MRQNSSFWDALMLAVEESLAAFSGVSPDMVGHSKAVSKTTRPAAGRFTSTVPAPSICRRFWPSAPEKKQSDKVK